MQKTVVSIKNPTHEGTGFNVSPDGLIITNYHVVKDAPSVTITFYDGKMFSAKEWTPLPEIDIALIKINGKDLPTIQLEEDGLVSAGDTVTIIGNPLGFQRVITRGKITSLSSVEEIDSPVLTIEGTIYQGSSGSPVTNENNKVIGVIFATLRNDDIENKDNIIGLAIPASQIVKHIKKVLENSST
ncbi:MAG: trypsin-like peptidase domain-containing protein [Clostridiaceae bacterium]|nr:trypsin-like peptidase domain-containing protein [Clostridiaceae bacterium]